MDRKAELPEDGSVSGNWATVMVQDVYHGLEPAVKRGEIKQIAVVQEMEKSTHSPQNHRNPHGGGMRNIAVFGFQFPLVSCGATYAPKKVWGFADVKPNGSAAFHVPAEVPIYFLALDGEGRALQRMRTFTHFMPGEVQTCVGCHADRNSVTPHGSVGLDLIKAPQELTAPPWGVKGFSYREVVQPVLDRNCIACHNERQQAGGVDLSGDLTDFFNVSYDVLCRTGTQGAWNWQSHGSPSGRAYDRVRGMSPYTEWIWTINGAEENILEIAPRRWGSPASKLACSICERNSRLPGLSVSAGSADRASPIASVAKSEVIGVALRFQIASSPCESASSPLAIVTSGGRPSVSSGSSSATVGRRSGRASEYFLALA